MKLWIDDVRPAPQNKDYITAKSVNEAIEDILDIEDLENKCGMDILELIDVDHDAGDYAQYGGDYIKLLDWLEETGRNYPIHIHSMNSVGIQNMRRIIQKNGWKEV